MTAAAVQAPRKKYHPICDLEDLQTHLQWAFTVELSTLPPYLTALYSIQDKTSEAYQIIRSVALEEMLHMNLASNLMNSIGASPLLTGANTPTYPGFMPHHAAGGPFIELMPASEALMRAVFMEIEKPEPTPVAPPEGDDYQTLGQFYKAIELGFICCAEKYGEKELFAHDTGFQRTDIYLGSGGGRAIRVHNLKTAKAAIGEIVEQGEGAELRSAPAEGLEPWGGYDHYGERSDGTYGPILGVPWEMSHYRKFEALANGEIPIPATYPMQPNPSTAALAGDVRQLSELFNDCYGFMLRALETTLGSNTRPDPFFTAAFPTMQSILPRLADLLMRTPVLPAASSDLGPTAGPSFEYSDTPLPAILDKVRRLADARPSWDAVLEGVANELEKIRGKLGDAVV